MTAQAVLDVCNGVLLKLEKDTLADSTDLSAPVTTDEHIFASRLEPVLRDVMSLSPWQCIRQRGELTEDPVNPPAFGYARRYPYPRSVLGIVKVGLDGYWGPHAPGAYEIEGNAILCGAARAQVIYTWYPWPADYDTPELYDTAMQAYIEGWTAPLRKLAELQAAWELCKALGGSGSLREGIFEELREARWRAIAQEFRHRNTGSFYSTDLVETRWR